MTTRGDFSPDWGGEDGRNAWSLDGWGDGFGDGEGGGGNDFSNHVERDPTLRILQTIRSAPVEFQLYADVD